jgi:hypothetical protein
MAPVQKFDIRSKWNSTVLNPKLPVFIFRVQPSGKRVNAIPTLQAEKTPLSIIGCGFESNIWKDFSK